MGQLGHSIYGYSNLIPFQFWLRETMPKPEKVSLSFVQDCTSFKNTSERLILHIHRLIPRNVIS